MLLTPFRLIFEPLRNDPVTTIVAVNSCDHVAVVVHGNHHDAWVNGAGDPSSGMAAELEEAEATTAMDAGEVEEALKQALSM